MQAKYQRNRDPDDQEILACDIDFALEMQNVSDDVEAREHVGVGKNIRSLPNQGQVLQHEGDTDRGNQWNKPGSTPDRKSTRLNSSHLGISYAVFCLKKQK